MLRHGQDPHRTAHSCLGLLWFAGWLFTIGYLKLGFWQGLLAFVIWPYDIGATLAMAGCLPPAVAAY